MLMATYMRSCQLDMIQHYKPIRKPFVPNGYENIHAKYRQMPFSDEKAKKIKSDAWKIIRERYFGYFKALEKCEADNASNYAFLTDMYEFFKANELEKYANTVKIVLTEHEEQRLVA